MPGNQVADTRTQDVMVLRDPQVIRLVFSKKHNMILKLIVEKELSISDISKALDINPGSVHYHLKDLEKHGLARLVREEVKGGIIKKYYRATARQILLDSPDFNKMEKMGLIDNTAFIERIIESIDYLGYHAHPENKDDVKEMLIRFDRRLRSFFDDTLSSGIENFEKDDHIVRSASMMVVMMRALEDPEIGRIHSEFNKMFAKYG